MDGVTATTEELNILDGVTSTTEELNLLNGSVSNTVINSKAVIYGSSGELAGTLSTASQANITSIGTLTSLTTSGSITQTGGNITLYNATNDGNPIIAIGSASTESLQITASYDSGAQTLEKVMFSTKATSALADKGKMEFYVDEALIYTIDDEAINLASGTEYKIEGTSVLSNNTLGSGIISSSLTSVGTLTDLVVNGNSDTKSLNLGIASKSTNYALTDNDHTIICTSSLTITLPSPSGIAGRMYVIKNMTGGVNTITIDPNGNNIDGLSMNNTELDANYDVITLQTDGTDWFIISKYLN